MGKTNNTNGYSVSYRVSTTNFGSNNGPKQDNSQIPKPTMSVLPNRDISPAARRISMESYDPCIVRVSNE